MIAVFFSLLLSAPEIPDHSVTDAKLVSTFAKVSAGTGAGASTGSITLSVAASSCSDSGHAQIFTGTDSVAYCTLQAAVNALPRQICSTCQDTINVGAGTFAGARVSGFTGGGPNVTAAPPQGVPPALFIQGHTTIVTPTTGSASGTCTSAGAGTCTKTAANWTADDFKLKFFKITGGTGYLPNESNLYPIRTNSATVITWADTSTYTSMSSSTTFQIVSLDTVLSPDTGTSHTVILANNTASTKLSGFSFTSGSVSSGAFQIVGNNPGSVAVSGNYATATTPGGPLCVADGGIDVYVDHNIANTSAQPIAKSHGEQVSVVAWANYVYAQSANYSIYAYPPINDPGYSWDVNFTADYNYFEAWSSVLYPIASWTTIALEVVGNTAIALPVPLIKSVKAIDADIESNTVTSTGSVSLLLAVQSGNYFVPTNNSLSGAAADYSIANSYGNSPSLTAAQLTAMGSGRFTAGNITLAQITESIGSGVTQNVPDNKSSAWQLYDTVLGAPVLKLDTTTAANILTMTGNLAATNLSGTNTGNVTLAAVGSSPSANAASLSGQQLTLQPFDSTHPGVVPLSGGGTANFLRADGTWAGPTGGITALTGMVTASGTGSVAATVVTNANLTGPVTSSGNATAIANGAISNAMLANGAVANLSNTNSGDVTLTAVGSSPSANGASLSGQALTLQLADGSHPGLIGGTSAAQTLVPALTFSNAATFNGTVAINGNPTLATSATLQMNGLNTFNFGWLANNALAWRISSNVNHITFDNLNNITIMNAVMLTRMATITASTTQTLAAATVCSDICNVSSVANAGDAVRLGSPLSVDLPTAGRIIHVFNHGANAMSLFPERAASIICTPATIFGAATCGSAGASISVAAGEIIDCVQYDTTANWGCK